MKRCWEYIKALYTRFKNLFFNGETEWRVVASENEVNPFVWYVVPNIVLCCLLTIVGNLVKSQNWEHFLLDPLIMALSLFATYYVSVYASRVAVKRIYNVDIQEHSNVSIIAYCMTVIFFVRMFLALAPDFFFIRAMALLTPYMMTYAMRELMPVENVTLDEETRRNTYLFVVSSVLILTPTLVDFLLRRVVLNNLLL